MGLLVLFDYSRHVLEIGPEPHQVILVGRLNCLFDFTGLENLASHNVAVVDPQSRGLTWFRKTSSRKRFLPPPFLSCRTRC